MADINLKMQLPAIKTQYAPAGDRHLGPVNMYGMLTSFGIPNEHVKIRMTAHSVGMAVGWRQACWWHNFWAVKHGPTWGGFWYDKATEEKIEGELVSIPPEQQRQRAWKAFATPRKAIQYWWDWFHRAERYKRSVGVLHDPELIADGEYFVQLKKDGYFTGDMTQQQSWSIHRRIRREVALATPGEMEAALAINLDAPLNSNAVFPGSMQQGPDPGDGVDQVVKLPELVITARPCPWWRRPLWQFGFVMGLFVVSVYVVSKFK